MNELEEEATETRTIGLYYLHKSGWSGLRKRMERKRGHCACWNAVVRSMRTAAHVRSSGLTEWGLNKFAMPSSLRLARSSRSDEQSRPGRPVCLTKYFALRYDTDDSQRPPGAAGDFHRQSDHVKSTFWKLAEAGEVFEHRHIIGEQRHVRFKLG